MELKFSERLKFLRINKNLKQTDIANEFKVVQTSIARWENGKQEPDYRMLMDIAKFFDVTTDYLLGLEDEFGNKIK